MAMFPTQRRGPLDRLNVHGSLGATTGNRSSAFGAAVLTLSWCVAAWGAAPPWQPPFAEQPPPIDELVVELKDSEGKPVADARIGTWVGHGTEPSAWVHWKVGWRSGKLIKRPLVSDANGIVRTTDLEPFKYTSPDEAVAAVYAWHAHRNLIGVGQFHRDQKTVRVVVTMVSPCRVQASVVSSELSRLDQMDDRAGGYIWFGGWPVLSCFSGRGSFSVEFLLPPGQYEFRGSISGSELGARTFEVKHGQRELDLGTIDVPARTFTRLLDRPAPELQGITHWAFGKSVRLADLRGKVVLLHLMGPRPSLQDSLIEVYQRHKDEGLAVVALYAGLIDSPEQLRAEVLSHLDKHDDVPFPVGMDTGGQLHTEWRLHHKWQTRGLMHDVYGSTGDHTILIDREGKVSGHVWPGLQPRFDDDIAAAISEGPSNPKGNHRQSTTPRPTTRPAVDPNDALTFRILDPDAKPVSSAKVGVRADWSFRHQYPNRPYVRVGRSVGGRTPVADSAGVVTVSREEIFRDGWPADRPMALFVWDAAGARAALIEVRLSDLGSSRQVTLSPACHVQGTLTSGGLQEIGQALEWANTYVYWNERHRPVQCASKEQEFEFWLPPGRYKVRAYGTDTYDATQDLTIQPGEIEKKITLDLPADHISTLIGKPAPELRRIKGWKNGGPVKLADLRGKVVLLDFWGHWCGPCIQGMPKLMELHDAYADKGLVIIAIHDDSVASIEDMDDRLAQTRKKYWGGRDLPFLVALDGGGSTPVEGSDREAKGATTAAYGISSFPTGVLIGRDGTVLEEFHPQDPDAVARLERLLGVQPSPAGRPAARGDDDSAPWRQRFDAVYRLEPGEVVKRIAPPFIPERKQYYLATLSGQADVIPEPPDYFKFLWPGSLAPDGYGFCGEVTLSKVLSILGVARNEYEAPPELLKLIVPGDWIVRKASSTRERLTALEAILRDELGASIRFQQRQVKRPVIVARGRFQFRSLTGRATYDPDMVHIFADVLDADEGYGLGRGTVAEFLTRVGAELNVTVADETEPSSDTILTILAWGTHRSCQLKRMPEGAQKWAKVDLILENLSKQTSLEFTRQERLVDLWLVSRQDDN
ncbi:MAG TPA: TlpA disulfide reductase family protein [Phycisphaerae bacterium]|nr:TlpA disulfide reductase family protein [Phycisphaerae bacterium]